MALLENSKQVKQVNDLRARNTSIWTETKRRVEEALKKDGPIQRLPNPLWRFTRSFQYVADRYKNPKSEQCRLTSRSHLFLAGTLLVALLGRL